jgi:hypothetical protein
LVIEQYCHCCKPIEKKEMPQKEISELLNGALEKRKKIVNKRNISLNGILLEN